MFHHVICKKANVIFLAIDHFVPVIKYSNCGCDLQMETGMCDIGDCDIRAKQNTSQKTIPTAEDTFITENINPYFSVLHELTVIWRPLA